MLRQGVFVYHVCVCVCVCVCVVYIRVSVCVRARACVCVYSFMACWCKWTCIYVHPALDLICTRFVGTDTEGKMHVRLLKTNAEGRAVAATHNRRRPLSLCCDVTCLSGHTRHTRASTYSYAALHAFVPVHTCIHTIECSKNHARTYVQT